ncbi:hypothetical protein [Flavobacterium ginsenosidimutans]|uniref:hypothetical protein n=1 Tax=Flavobacterium ginsenosidimutans TaxID=687844 RepID=UPI000DAEC4C0|nr:hypothetical protein [Flavobacterium ginsenosidimutans]KAF2334182.1 hypothetical protein DM444_07130 [Flavobacterium ginsenosidimutans]
MNENIKSQEEIKKIIIDIEQKWPVDRWIVNGIHIWPLVRIKIYTHYLSKLLSVANGNNSNNVASAKKNAWTEKIKKSYSIISFLYFLMFFFLRLKKKKIVFFGAHFHRVLQNGVYFNRFYDSMIEAHNLKEDVYVIEYRKVNPLNFNQQAIIDLEKYLGAYRLIIKMLNKFKSKENVYALEGYKEFYDYLDLKMLGIELESLINWSLKINSLKRFFNILFKKIEPQKIVFLGYYGLDDLTAAVVSANEMQIKTVDLQHGTQINNMAFNSWTKFPESGFNTVVKEFWTWDEESKKAIDLWASKTSNTTAKTIGQPYVSYWLNKRKEDFSKPNKILYTLHLSKIEEMLGSDLIFVIKNINYQWILRLHPRNSIAKEDLENFLEINKIKDKVIIQSPIEMPLPKVLSESVLHVTNYSGALIEARMMNIPSVIINKLGLEIYEQYIDNELVHFIDNESLDFCASFQTLIRKIETRKSVDGTYKVFNPLLNDFNII